MRPVTHVDPGQDLGQLKKAHWFLSQYVSSTVTNYAQFIMYHFAPVGAMIDGDGDDLLRF